MPSACHGCSCHLKWLHEKCTWAIRRGRARAQPTTCWLSRDQDATQARQRATRMGQDRRAEQMEAAGASCVGGGKRAAPGRLRSPPPGRKQAERRPRQPRTAKQGRPSVDTSRGLPRQMRRSPDAGEARKELVNEKRNETHGATPEGLRLPAASRFDVVFHVAEGRPHSRRGLGLAAEIGKRRAHLTHWLASLDRRRFALVDSNSDRVMRSLIPRAPRCRTRRSPPAARSCRRAPCPPARRASP